MEHLLHTDPQIASLIHKEEERVNSVINLIASENYPSQAVCQAQGSILTAKYAEGYSGKRYYGGCTVVDEVENLAIERCKKLFGAEHVNVQPHSGSQANLGVFFAILKPRDTILGMSLAAGGHLTHGHPITISGTHFNSVQYGVDQHTEEIDYDMIDALADKHRPKLIIIGASSYSRIIDFERAGAIAKKYNALLLADIAHIAGLVAAGLHPNPFPHADFVTSTTHKTLRGPRGGLIMCKQEFASAIDKAIMPGIQGGPCMHTIAAKAVCFHEALQPEFVDYQQQVLRNATIMAQAFQEHGYRIVSGGTDNHLFVVDLRSLGISGRDAEAALASEHIIVNRNCIPFDPAKPWITSGIRIGTPAITTRGAVEEDCKNIVERIDTILKHHILQTNQAILQTTNETINQ